MTTASLLPPVKRNYGGGGNVDGYLHRARIQSDTMDHFDPNVSLFCSRGRRNEKHHLAILTGWRASPERWLQPGPRPAFRFIQAPAFTKAFFKVNHTTDAGGFFSSFFFLFEEVQARKGEGGRPSKSRIRGDEWNYNEERSRWSYFSRGTVLNFFFFLRGRWGFKGRNKRKYSERNWNKILENFIGRLILTRFKYSIR